MKNLFLGILICFFCFGCSNSENNTSTVSDSKVRKAEKAVDPSSFQTPYESKIWDVMRGEVTEYSKVIKFYRTEKIKYDNELHFENTMDTWHKTLAKFSSDMTLTDAEEVLEDMDNLPTNIISYSTYYKLISNFPEIKGRRGRLDIFYKKNMEYLLSKEWKNEGVRQGVIMGFESNQMMINL
jgi:hypothetical protein